ncbi:cupredoxin domain-containing protein [Prosthecobacter sp.]|uniref:cupredoxin domain-containing protein n=1 Tax=Prosthecobacter sp. TaxID=1965333 RepID=UPI0037847105
MKHTTLILLAFATAISFSAAEDKTPATTTGEKPKSLLKKTEDATAAAGHALVNGTKKAGRAIKDAVTPDSDAQKVEVTINDSDISVPKKLGAGKTAFMVKNTGKEKHNFHIMGKGVDEKFYMDIAANDTKVMHVQLKPGTYQVTCPNKEKQGGDSMKHTLTVE